MGQFFLTNQKSDEFTGQLVGQETDQNHMDVPKILSADWLRPENEMINRFYLMHISIPITMILPVLSIDWHIGKIVNWRHDKQVHVFSHFVSPCYALRIELGIHFFHWRTKYFDATLQTLFIYQIWCEDKGSMIFDHELYFCGPRGTNIIAVITLNFVQNLLEK